MRELEDSGNAVGWEAELEERVRDINVRIARCRERALGVSSATPDGDHHELGDHDTLSGRLHHQALELELAAWEVELLEDEHTPPATPAKE